MDTLKKVLGIVTVAAIVALTALGGSEADVGLLVTLGIGAGGAIAAIIAFLVKKKEE